MLKNDERKNVMKYLHMNNIQNFWQMIYYNVYL